MTTVEYMRALGASDRVLRFAATLPDRVADARIRCVMRRDAVHAAADDALRCSAYTAPEIVRGRLARLDAVLAAQEAAR